LAKVISKKDGDAKVGVGCYKMYMTWDIEFVQFTHCKCLMQF